MPFIDVNGARLHYTDEGEGTTMIRNIALGLAAVASAIAIISIF